MKKNETLLLLNNFYRFKILLLSLFLVFFSCETLEDDSDIYNPPSDTGNNNSSNWSNGYWLKSSGNTYMDLSNSVPVFCANGNVVGGTYSDLRWEDANTAFFTLYNNGDERILRITKSGSNLILAPWDEISQSTNNPSTYTPVSDFPCSGSNSGGGGGNNSTTEGKVAFFVKSDKGCGNITITVDGNTTKTISQYYTQGINGCSEGTIFTLSQGSHSFTATCGNYTWSSTFSITADGCLTFELT